jgi:hypothetical protein
MRISKPASTAGAQASESETRWPPPRRQTTWLTLLLACVAAWVPLTYLRLAKCRDDAEVAARNLGEVKLALTEIQVWRASPGRAAPASMESPQLTQQLRDAAAAAGLPDAPGSEAGDSRRLANSDYTELPVYLRFEPLTLRQLTVFLHTLTQIDPASRSRSIELSAPEAVVGPSGEERWRADVEVDWLSYSPQKR